MMIFFVSDENWQRQLKWSIILLYPLSRPTQLFDEAME